MLSCLTNACTVTRQSCLLYSIASRQSRLRELQAGVTFVRLNYAYSKSTTKLGLQ